MYTFIFSLYSLFYYGVKEICVFLSKILAFLAGVLAGLFGYFLYFLVFFSPFLFLLLPDADLEDKIMGLGALFLYAGFFSKLSIEKSFWLFMYSFFFYYVAYIFGLTTLAYILAVTMYIFLMSLVYNSFIKEDINEASKLLPTE